MKLELADNYPHKRIIDGVEGLRIEPVFSQMLPVARKGMGPGPTI